MDILIADDDHVSLIALRRALQRWGHQVHEANRGDAAWELLQRDDAPRLAILDWMMPGMDGPEVCRRVRARTSEKEEDRPPAYLILLTGRSAREDIIAGLDSGADDYIVKPFDADELRARLNVGLRILSLQESLAQRVRELNESLQRVRQLQGLLPICSYCKRIRDDQNYWQQVEGYITTHTDARFSHSICPACYEKEVKPQIEEARRASGGPS
jgi:DNA-binding response OmpR family regulator